MKTNRRQPRIYTHEGGTGDRRSLEPNAQLQRTVSSCLLWEDNFYEDGESVVERIAKTVPQADPNFCMTLVGYARNTLQLRHVPLQLIVEMVKHESHRPFVELAVCSACKRPDEMTELLSLYAKANPRPSGRPLQKLPNSMKRGLRRVFPTFSEYQLAKWDRPGAVRLRDVMFLTHPFPLDIEQEATWKALANGTLKGADTWEAAISGAKGDDAKARAEWQRLLRERKLGGLALLRNLRNMQKANVPSADIRKAITENPFHRVLPFRFITAERYAPQYSAELEAAMLARAGEAPKFAGRTAVVVDNSYSMMGPKVSAKSELTRWDAAAALAIILRERCADVRVYAFSGSVAEVPNRRGFGLRDAIHAATDHASTYLSRAISYANQQGYDRIFVVTDEQSHDGIVSPLRGTQAYLINVASYRVGVDYSNWTHIHGWSESILDFAKEVEI